MRQPLPRAAVRRSYDSRSHRRPEIFPAPGMRGKYGAEHNALLRGRPARGFSVLQQLKLSRLGGPILLGIRNGIPSPLRPLVIVARGGARSKGGK